MIRTKLAVFALAAGMTMTAAASDSPAQPAQAAPDQEAIGSTEGMRGMMGGHDGTGPMHGMMHRMVRRSPKERCEERLARRAAVTAYTVSKLNLTTEQKPLWDKLNGILQSAADKERQLCGSLPTQPGRQAGATILDRMSRREQFLSARLDAIRQARPALETLYNSLTPDQKTTIDHPFQR
jgi:LTXXQ motif family protein